MIVGLLAITVLASAIYFIPPGRDVRRIHRHMAELRTAADLRDVAAGCAALIDTFSTHTIIDPAATDERVPSLQIRPGLSICFAPSRHFAQNRTLPRNPRQDIHHHHHHRECPCLRGHPPTRKSDKSQSPNRDQKPDSHNRGKETTLKGLGWMAENPRPFPFMKAVASASALVCGLTNRRRR